MATVATKVRVVDNSGEPVTGALVSVSDFDAHWHEVDEDGKYTMQFEEAQVVAAMVAIKVGDAIYTVKLALEAGDEKDVTIL